MQKHHHWFTMTPHQVFDHFDQRLAPWAVGDLFRVYRGTLPMALVAHVDTVHHNRGSFPPALIQDGHILTASNGLGADDRAGVMAIDALLASHYHPWIILLDKEEVGCLGAKALAAACPDGPPVNYALELDRRGRNDVVYYDFDPDAGREFSRRIESAGFERATGTCSDISHLGPTWDLACANLSIGYEHEHTFRELLHLDWWQATVEKVARLLDDVGNLGRFPYSPVDFPRAPRARWKSA